MRLFNTRNQPDENSEGEEPATAQPVSLRPVPESEHPSRSNGSVEPTRFTPAAPPAAFASGLRVASDNTAGEVARPQPAQPPAEEAKDESEDLRNLPLGTLLYKHELVGKDELEEALTRGMRSGERLGEILVSSGAVTEDDIARMLCVQRGLRFLAKGELGSDPAARALLSPEDARRLQAAPLRFEGAVVVVVSPDPAMTDRDELERLLGRPAELAVVTVGDFERLLNEADAPAPAPIVELAPVEPPAEAEASVDPEPLPWAEAEAESDAAGEDDSAEAEPLSSDPEAFESWTSDSQTFEPQTADPVGADDEGGAHGGDEPVGDDPEAGESQSPESAPLEPESWNGWDGAPEVAAEEQTAVDEPVEDEAAVEPAVEPWSHDAEREGAVEQDPAAGPELVDGSRLAGLESGREESVDRIEQLLERIEAGATTFSDLRSQLDGLGRDLATAQESLSDREQRLAELGSMHDADQLRIEELLGELQARERELSELGGSVAELGGRLAMAEERLDERDRRVAELDASFAEGARRVDELFRQVELRDRALASIAEKLDSLAERFA